MHYFFDIIICYDYVRLLCYYTTTIPYILLIYYYYHPIYYYYPMVDYYYTNIPWHTIITLSRPLFTSVPPIPIYKYLNNFITNSEREMQENQIAQSIFCCNFSTDNQKKAQNSDHAIKNTVSESPTLEQMMFISKQKMELQKILEKKQQMITILKNENEQLKSELSKTKKKLNQYSDRELQVNQMRQALDYDFRQLKVKIMEEQNKKGDLEKKLRTALSELDSFEATLQKYNEQKRNNTKLMQKLEWYQEEQEKWQLEINQYKIRLLETRYKQIEGGQQLPQREQQGEKCQGFNKKGQKKIYYISSPSKNKNKPSNKNYMNLLETGKQNKSFQIKSFSMMSPKTSKKRIVVSNSYIEIDSKKKKNQSLWQPQPTSHKKQLRKIK